MNSSDADPTVVPWLTRVLALAAVNTIAGRAGLLLAIPPGYATVAWPPSGIALACVLQFGDSIWPGVLLGSLLINLFTSYDPSTSGAMVTSLAVAASIAAGSSVQAVAAARLIRRFVGFPNPLVADRDIVLFLGLGGPVGCLVAATWGVGTLYLAGLVPWANCPLSWFTWWVGDTIGVLCLAPLVLVWIASPRAEWRRRRLSVALPLCLTFAMAVTFFAFARARGDQATQRDLDRRAVAVTQSLGGAIDEGLEVLDGVVGLLEASPGVDRKSFRIFVSQTLATHPEILAVSFNPEVTRSSRPAFEAAMRQEGFPDFQIREENSHGDLVPAGARPTYVPIRLIEPYASNASLVGYDAASNPSRNRALARARATGLPAATEPTVLVPSHQGRRGIVVFAPVRAWATGGWGRAKRDQDIRGFAAVALGVEDLVGSGLTPSVRADMHLRIEDSTAPASLATLYDDGSGLGKRPRSGPPPMVRTTSLAVAGRRWTLRITPTRVFIASQTTLIAWVVLGGGLLLTGLLGGLLLVLTGRTSRVWQLVDDRTAELSRANLRLEQEVGERKTAQADTAVARDQALEAARIKSEFLATMSHEIRTPMNAITGMTGLLMGTRLTGEQHEYARLIQEGAQNLLAIVDDVLDISKIEAGKMALEPTAFDFRTTVESVAEFLAIRAQEKGLELVVNYPPGVPSGFVGDEGRIRQILVNLLGNAIKFTDAGHVLVRVRAVAESEKRIRLHIDVQDTGIGISTEMIPLLFQKFRQAEVSPARRHGGTGLGLAICKQLVELMGGSIGAASRAGEGSTFWFEITLPASGDSPARKLDLTGARILVVDPVGACRQALGECLQHWNARHDSAASAAEALDRLAGARDANDPYRIALIDGLSPATDLLSPVSAREHPGPLECTRTVLMAGLGFQESSAKASPAVDAVLLKPVRQALLARTVAVLCGIAGWDLGPSAPIGERSGPGPDPRGPSAGPVLLTPASHPRVLVVDDNATNRLLAAMTLDRLGCTVDVAAGGQDALQLVDLVRYHLVVMDCGMPLMDGYEVTRRIRSRPIDALRGTRSDVPIVGLTAHALPGDRERCLGAGMNDYLSKPTGLVDLQQMLEKWVGVHRGQIQSGREATAPAVTAPAVEIDVARLAIIRAAAPAGDATFLRKVVESFLAQAGTHVAAMRSAAVADDRATVIEVAHALQGSSANIGAQAMACICRRIQDVRAELSREETANLIDDLERELGRASALLMRASDPSA